MKRLVTWKSLTMIFLLSLMVIMTVAPALALSEIADKIGVGISLGGRSLEFIDAAKTLRAWATISDPSGPAPIDENGWPTTDAKTVFFDFRPIPAWDPPVDDPEEFQIDVSGTYKLSFTGQAVLSSAEGFFEIQNQVYHPATNTTTADIIVPPGKALVFVNFTQTKRLPTDVGNTGVTNVKLIRPGFSPDTTEVFNPAFLRSIQPFSTFRFMGWVFSNNTNPLYPGVVEWAERKLPTDATQEQWGTKRDGGCWEYAIDLCNLSGKNIWVNLPVAATDDYVRQLALLLQQRLNPALKIYVEWNNEVWNPGFTQYTYNREAAIAEVNAGGSPLNNDGSTDPNIWTMRRYAKRTVEISNIFREVFGGAAINDKVRVVNCWWFIFPWQYEEQLNWIKRTYGEPSQFIYGIAEAPYFNISSASDTASVPELLTAFRESSDGSYSGRLALTEVANRFGVKNLCYEGGSDTGGGSTVNVANRIRAERDPEMKEISIHDLRNNWFPAGGDLFMYLELCSAYSRYGCWGLTEDITNLNTPKFQAVYDLVNNTAPVPTKPIATAKAGDKQVTLTWRPIFIADSYEVKRSTSPDGPFITVASSTSTMYTDAGVRNGTTYYYTVSAVNENGKSANSFVVSAMPEPAPSFCVNEHFNNQPTGANAAGWSVFGNVTGTIAEIPDAVNKSMYIRNPGWVDNAVYKTFAPQTGVLTFEFNFRAEGDGSGAIISLGDGNQAAVTFFHFWDWMNYGIWGAGLKKLFPGNWYRMKVVADIPAQNADIYINDSLMMENCLFLTQVTNLNQISFGNISWANWAGAYYDDIKVYDESAVSGVFLNTTAKELVAGDQLALNAVVTPLKARNKAVVWNSSDSSVATVDQNGLVTGLAAGVASITVTTVDGGLTDTCVVTVVTAESLTARLTGVVEGYGLDKGLENSLVSKLDNALKSLEKGNETPAVNQLEAFKNEVAAQAGKKLTVAQAEELTAAADRIIGIIHR